MNSTLSKQDQLKKQVAEAALAYVEEDSVVGVGTGSTTNFFIDGLVNIKHKIEGAVASSEATADRLKKHGIRIFELNAVDDIPVYVDGADEVDRYLNLIKGGGGALTREKILASVAQTFVCIADQSKKVAVLGKFPLPIEVIPMARSHVARNIVRLGGDPVYRNGFVTDNGNIILDVHGMSIAQPAALEEEINNIVGVVTNGLFARRGADILLLGTEKGVETIRA